MPTTTGKTAGTSVLNDPTTGIMLCIIFIGSSSYAATTTGKTAGTSELNPPTSTESHHTDTPVFATCDEDTTCSIEEYCFKGQCSKCERCESWHGRQPPSPVNGTSCAKSAAECGICLPGFQEPGSTPSSQRGECSQTPTSLTSNQWQLNVIFLWLTVLSVYVCYKNLPCTNSIGDNINRNLGNSSNGRSNPALNEIVTVSREVESDSHPTNHQTITKPSAGNLPRNGHSDSVPNGHPVPNSVEFSYQNQSVQVQHESQQN